jgi:uncharacterized membrane protein YkvA (DUF1232 family)
VSRLEGWKQRVRRLKSEVRALYLAYGDPRTPLYARVLVLLVVGYALSPIDLIPDFVPVLGYLDDLVLIPLGIALAIRMIPAPVLAECREKARNSNVTAGRGAIVLVVLTWALLAALAVLLALRLTA